MYVCVACVAWDKSICDMLSSAGRRSAASEIVALSSRISPVLCKMLFGARHPESDAFRVDPLAADAAELAE